MLFVLNLLSTVSICFAQPIAKSFPSALQEVMNAPEYQATENDIRAIELDYESRELVLEPTLQMSAKRANENRQLINPFASQRPRVDTYSLILAKPFSTGTLISIGPSFESSVAPWLTPTDRNQADWNISLTQSLWKDFFGRSTRIRRAREEFERKQELAAALLKRATMLTEFENLYWDWALSLREAELQEKNLKRSREILRWVQDRFNRAAAESTDLLQAKALLTQSELRVSAVTLGLTQVVQQIERFAPDHQWQPNPDDLQVMRPLQDLVARWKADELGKPSTLAFLAAQNAAGASEESAKEARESIRPELDFQATYGKNAIDPEGDAAIRRSYREDHDYSSLGFVFRTGLDLHAERKKVASARAARDAAKLRRASAMAENKVAWDQLQREIQDQQDRITRAKELVDLQLRKANAERERYRKGRSTAFQAITFEQEAVDSEITLWQLYALMRKTEARARLFAN